MTVFAPPVKIAPSLLSADFSKLGQEVARLEAASCEYIHLDVMDGHFVPNLTFGYQLVKAIRPYSKKKFDVHLMMSHPERYYHKFIEAGADLISVHREVNTNLPALLNNIRAAGAKASLAYNPHTSLGDLDSFLPHLDQLLLMSVQPGFAGQAFIPQTLKKGAAARKKILASGFKVELEIDGGINAQNAAQAHAAGFNVIVAGSYLFSAPQLDAALAALRPSKE